MVVAVIMTLKATASRAPFYATPLNLLVLAPHLASAVTLSMATGATITGSTMLPHKAPPSKQQPTGWWTLSALNVAMGMSLLSNTIAATAHFMPTKVVLNLA